MPSGKVGFVRSFKCRGLGVRNFILLVFLFFSIKAFAVDDYALCYVYVEKVKLLAKNSLQDLVSYKGMIAKTTSIEELDALTGFGYMEFVPLIQDEHKISLLQAEHKTFEIFKTLEIIQVNLAIEFNGVSDLKTWNLAFDRCVEEMGSG